jgi:hypothetical protein
MTNSILRFSLAVALAALLVGCAGGVQRRAQVCPQCHEVVVKVIGTALSGADWQSNPAEIREHNCPGCHSALAAFLHNGSLKHTCSICTRGDYSCPSGHG